MRDGSSAKLFHAIVGLGLAAVGCGGEILDVTDEAGHPSAVPDADDVAVFDASVELPPPFAETGPSEEASAEGAADVAEDVPIDAGMAKDAAHDVAREVWPPPPIK